MSTSTKCVMSCARMLKSSDILIRPRTAGMTFANLLMSRMRSLTIMAWSVVTRSNLFRIILSANATCWYASLTLPSSTSSSSLPRMCFESTIEITASKRSSSVIAGSDMKVRTIGTGSAMPVVSIMMPSIWLPRLISFMISISPLSKSPRIVQHMQPLSITTIFSASDSFSFFSSASSMDISPNSFSMIAIFLSFCSCRM
mmetsp:Transcript_103629/g.206019  ORF Transcript_103629/g.206019 Transcript_103629/m.206019 type:complete len:200 (-) Transcript_103629:468-1067(-)